MQIPGDTSLASVVSPLQLVGLIETAQSMEDEDNRVKLLEILASRLPESALVGLIETAQSMEDEDNRVRLLETLFFYLSESVLVRLIETAQFGQRKNIQFYLLKALIHRLNRSSEREKLWVRILHLISLLDLNTLSRIFPILVDNISLKISQPTLNAIVQSIMKALLQWQIRQVKPLSTSLTLK